MEESARLGMAWGLDNTAGHNTEKDCGAVGIEGTVHSGYEGAYAGGTGAIELELLWSIPFLTLLICCKQSQPVSVHFTAQDAGTLPSLYVVVLKPGKILGNEHCIALLTTLSPNHESCSLPTCSGRRPIAEKSLDECTLLD